MIDATSEVLTSIRADLMADPVLFGLVGDRISSDWSLKLAPPFIRLQIPTVLPFEDDCKGKGSDHRCTVHVFTRERGTAQRGLIVDRVRGVLDDAALELFSSDAWWCEFTGSIQYTDPDDPELQISRVAFSITTTDGA